MKIRIKCVGCGKINPKNGRRTTSFIFKDPNRKIGICSSCIIIPGIYEKFLLWRK